MSKVKERESNAALIVVVVLIIAVLIIGFETITINYNSRKREDKLSKSAHENNETNAVTKKGIYDTSNIKFKVIKIDNLDVGIEDICFDGCNLSIEGAGVFFIIKKNMESSQYKLDLVYNNNTLLENHSLGLSLVDAFLKNYGDNLVLSMKIKEDKFFYDYALFISRDGRIDEISSLDANEMEFLENGIVYYYDVCDEVVKGVGRKVKAIRAPFSETPAIISSSPANFEWCS